MMGAGGIGRGVPWTLVVIGASMIAGLLVAHGDGALVVGLVLVAAILAAPMEYKLGAAFVLIAYPFSPGSVGPIPNLLVAELLVPVAFPAVALVATRTGRPLLPPSGRRFGVASGLLLAVTAFHFVTGPVLGSISGSVSFGSSGLRPFFDLVVYLMLFFMAVWMLDWMPAQKRSWVRFLSVIMYASLALSVVRLVTVNLGGDTPLMTGVFDYGGTTVLAGGVRALRIGGLAETAGMGLACLAALWTMRSIRTGPAVSLLLWFLLCVGLSGGRSLTAGVLVAMLAYFLGPARGRRLTLITGSVIVMATALALAYQYGYATQISRILAVQGGIAQQDPARAEVFRILWGYFLANPLIGKGIGVAGEGLSDAFIAQQVVAGGHSSYISMLGNFGIIGGIFIAIFTFDPLWRSLVHTRRAPSELTHSLTQGLMTFVLIQTSIRSMEYVVGGTGYQDPRMYLGAALFVVVGSYLMRSLDDTT